MTDLQLEELLKCLALQAQQKPPQSVERQQILHEIINFIQHSKKLQCPQKNFDRDLYEDAKQNLWYYLYAHIEQYDPIKGSVITWVNFLLFTRYYPEAVAAEAKEQNIAKNIRNSAKSSINSSFIPKKALELQELIALDPDGIFKEKFIKNCPNANFQKLTELYLAGYSWKEISKKLGVEYSTLRSFYYRSFSKFKLLLRQYLSD